MKLVRTSDWHGWLEPFWGLFDWPELTRVPKPMRVEEFTEDGTYVVKAELAGLDPDKDVHVEVVDGTLRIQAERRQETKIDEKGYYRSEIRYGTFFRMVPLPPGATEDDVKATYKDGILEVRVPVPPMVPAAETKKIPITHA